MPCDPFYTSAAWRTFRASILRARPVCEVAGCERRSSHADHIVSRRDGGAPLDGRNIQALCASHHSSKTAQVDGGFGNRRGGNAKLIVRGCDENGTPLDPSHNWREGTADGLCGKAARGQRGGLLRPCVVSAAGSSGILGGRGSRKSEPVGPV